MKPFDDKEVHAFVEIALHKRELELGLEKANQELQKAYGQLKEEIASRKEAEKKRRESDERFKAVYEQSPIGIEIYDRDGRLLHVNRSCQAIFGITDNSKVKGFRLFDDPNISKENKSRLQLGEKIRYEVAFDFEKVRKSNLYETTRSGIGYLDVLITPLGDNASEVNGYMVQVVDITARKKTEQKLKENEEKFRLIAESSFENFWQLGLNGHVTYVSPAVKNMLGYMPQEAYGLRFETFFPSFEIDRAKEAFKAAISGKSHQLIEFTGRKKDGSNLLMEVSTTPILEEKKVVGVQGVVRDITARKHAEKALKESERRFRALFENISDGVYVHDEKGRIHDVNQTGYERLGYTRQEMLKLTAADVDLDHPTMDIIQQTISPALEKGPLTIESRHGTKDGRVIHVELQMSAFDHQGGKVFVTIARDITQRKQMEQALKENEERLDAIFNTVNAGILQVNPEGKIIFTNQRMEELFGYSMTSLVGSRYTHLVHDTESNSANRKMLGLIRGEISQISQERRYQRKDGTAFWGHISGNRLNNPDGSLRSLLGVITDISKRKRLEEELQQAEKMEAIATLTGGIAHDYNNLMYVILGNLSMAMEDASPHSPLTKFIQEAHKAGEKAGNLTLAVKDQGKSISRENLSKVFDPYFSTKEMGRQKGMGLGLATAYAIVQKHGGLLALDSTRSGTTANIFLTVVPE